MLPKSQKESRDETTMKNAIISYFEDIKTITIYNILKNLLTIEKIPPFEIARGFKESEELLFKYFSKYGKKDSVSDIYNVEEPTNYNKKIKEYYYPHPYIPAHLFIVPKNEFWENFYGKLYVVEDNVRIKGYPHHAVGPKFYAKCLYNISKGDMVIARNCPTKDKYACLFINWICNKMSAEDVETIFRLLKSNKQIHDERIIEFMNSKNKHLLQHMEESDKEEIQWRRENQKEMAEELAKNIDFLNSQI